MSTTNAAAEKGRAKDGVNVSGAINQAIWALNAAYEQMSGSAEVLKMVGDAQLAMEALRDQIVAFDAQLNANEEVPTGQSYNDLMDLIGLLSMDAQVNSNASNEHGSPPIDATPFM